VSLSVRDNPGLGCLSITREGEVSGEINIPEKHKLHLRPVAENEKDGGNVVICRGLQIGVRNGEVFPDNEQALYLAGIISRTGQGHGYIVPVVGGYKVPYGNDGTFEFVVIK